jgi:hypothetical protein
MNSLLKQWYLPLTRSHDPEVNMGSYASSTSTEELPTTSRIMKSLSSIGMLEPLRNDSRTSMSHGVPTQHPPPAYSTSSSNRGPTASSSSPHIDLHFPTPTLAELTDAFDRLTYASLASSEHYRRTNNPRIPPERRHATFYPNGVVFSPVVRGTLTSSSLPCGGTTAPPAYPENPPERRRVRRVRRPTHRPDVSGDPPPNYAVFDPYPFFTTETKNRRGVIKTIRKDGLKATTGKLGRSVARHVEDVGKLAKDMPTAVKTKRAKGKIRWLENNHYLSGQDRFLTRDLVE